MYLTNHTELFNAYLNMSVMKPLELIKKNSGCRMHTTLLFIRSKYISDFN